MHRLYFIIEIFDYILIYIVLFNSLKVNEVSVHTLINNWFRLVNIFIKMEAILQQVLATAIHIHCQQSRLLVIYG